MAGKLIVIEGTDCSGKETQANLLLEALHERDINVQKSSFPNYDSPPGRIVGGPYLGKEHISEGWFPEGATNVDPKVASLYYAADRRYNIIQVNELLKKGVNVLLDRYVYSNMAHQGGKISDVNERRKMYEFIETLEFDLLELPIADICIFLHMPYDLAQILKAGRLESSDEHEKNEEHLRNAEKVYLELSNRWEFKKIACFEDEHIKSIEDIHKEVLKYVLDKLEN